MEVRGDAGEAEARFLATAKAAEERGDQPLAWAAEAARVLAETGGELPSPELAAALVSSLCFANNTPYLWKLLDHAIVFRLVSPLQILALLTCRVIPNRRAQPEAYRLFLELLGRYVFAPLTLGTGATRNKIIRSIYDVLKLPQIYMACNVDCGYVVVMFYLKVITSLLDSIFEDSGLQYPSTDQDGSLYGIESHQAMDVDIKENSGDKRKGREKLILMNTSLAVEVVGKIVANKKSGTYLRLIHLNMPELFNRLLQRLKFIEVHKSSLQSLPWINHLYGQLAANMQQATTGKCLLRMQQLSGALVDIRNCDIKPSFGIRRTACWIPFDIFMENSMDAKNFHAISAIEILAEVTKTLQVVNQATWQETFQALWVSALRLVQRDCEPPEGPIPHLDARLCMLLSIIPLTIGYLLHEESDNASSVKGFSQTVNYNKDKEGKYACRRQGLLYSLQAIGQFAELLSPPKCVVVAANDAASKAATFLFNIKKGHGNLGAVPHNDSSVRAVGTMLHLIVEACVARKLIDSSVYFWPDYVVSSAQSKDSISVEESPWSEFMNGAPLTDALRNALIVTPATRTVELEKLYHIALSGTEEEKSSAARILCGASLVRGWNIQEHVVHIVVKLLTPPVPSEGTRTWNHLIGHMSMLNSVMTAISCVEIIHTLSLYGMIPEVAAALMPLCEAFGSLSPLSDARTSISNEISAYLVFSCAFLFLLRLWKFYRPPQEHCIASRGGNINPQLTLDFLLLLRNSRISLQNSSYINRTNYMTDSLNASSSQPVYIDSFPKLRAWYFQNQACIASTLSGLCNKNPVHQVANKILSMICRKMNRGGSVSSNLSSSSSGNVSGSPLSAIEDLHNRPMLPAWEVLEAIPFVLEALLGACEHGKISSRELTTGLRDLVDFLPASLATIISYLSAEISRGVWKPVSMNGSDWPSPAANLLSVESEIQEVLESAGVQVPRCYSCPTTPAMLPLPMAALVSLTITFKLDRNLEYIHGIVGQALEHCSSSFTWPSMPIIGALWTQKARRWHDFIILSCASSPFTQDKEAITQLIKSCFSSFLGPALTSNSHLVARRGVNGLLGQNFNLGSRLRTTPGILYLRSCRLFHDTPFVKEMIFKTIIDWAHVLARECSFEGPVRLQAGHISLGSAAARVKEVAFLGAALLCVTGGVQLVQVLYEETLPTFVLSTSEPKQGGGVSYDILKGYVMAYTMFLSGAIVWGAGDASLAYATIFSSRQARSFSIHMDFIAWVLDGNMSVGCNPATWKAYVLCFLSLVIVFMPKWVSKVKQDTLQKLAVGLRVWNEPDLAVAVLERGGLSAMTSVVETLM